MPTVKDKITGKVISRQPYNQKGIDNATVIADSKPEWEVTNAQDRTEIYAEGGKTGYNIMDKYKKGGKTKKKSKPRNRISNPDVAHIVEDIAKANKKYDEGVRYREPYIKGTKLPHSTVTGPYGIRDTVEKILKKKK